MAGRWELTDEQWQLVEPILRPTRREDNRGRPWHDTRAVLHGVFWPDASLHALTFRPV